MFFPGASIDIGIQAMNQPLEQLPLFLVNPGSGKGKVNWPEAIEEYFAGSENAFNTIELQENCDLEDLKNNILSKAPSRVIAVGGDGTLKLVAECLFQTDIPVGILPAGSANGMAKELNIPLDSAAAIQTAMEGQIKQIHLMRINGEYCIHLSDIGFNAFVVKYFETYKGRGMWNYVRACWKALWNQPQFVLHLHTDKETIRRRATMVVLANATQYGTGARINPLGRLDDELFEVILVKKISMHELYKMIVSHAPFDTNKTECIQVTSLRIETKKRIHFQVDGEYRGKVNKVVAAIEPHALKVIVP